MGEAQEEGTGRQREPGFLNKSSVEDVVSADAQPYDVWLTLAGVAKLEGRTTVVVVPRHLIDALLTSDPFTRKLVRNRRVGKSSRKFFSAALKDFRSAELRWE